MRMDRRRFLKLAASGLAVAAAPAVVVPERRIWQVGATLARPITFTPPGPWDQSKADTQMYDPVWLSGDHGHTDMRAYPSRAFALGRREGFTGNKVLASGGTLEFGSPDEPILSMDVDGDSLYIHKEEGTWEIGPSGEVQRLPARPFRGWADFTRTRKG